MFSFAVIKTKLNLCLIIFLVLSTNDSFIIFFYKFIINIPNVYKFDHLLQLMQNPKDFCFRLKTLI